jgi:hypothetical protein
MARPVAPDLQPVAPPNRLSQRARHASRGPSAWRHRQLDTRKAMPLADTRLRPFLITFATALALAAQGCASAQPSVPWQDGRSAGVEARADATASDLGMPLYPGATVRKDKPDDTGNVTFAIWGGSKGLKVSAAKYLSVDTPERVTAFYREALARFGNVLDCGNERPAAKAREKDDKALQCSASEVGKRTLKVGASGRERSVTVTPAAQGTLIELARVQFSD